MLNLNKSNHLKSLYLFDIQFVGLMNGSKNKLPVQVAQEVGEGLLKCLEKMTEAWSLSLSWKDQAKVEEVVWVLETAEESWADAGGGWSLQRKLQGVSDAQDWPT